MSERRAKPEGIAHRARLRALLLHRLRPGVRIPSSGWLGRFLGISDTQAHLHMRRMLREAGVVTETRRSQRGQSVWVVAIPEGRLAA